MAKGGARVRSGPAPDPGSLRSASADGWVALPPGGRVGDVPEWPLPDPMAKGELLDEVRARELELWAGLWSMPQAVEWERLGQQHLVGLYVRRLAEAEQALSPVVLSTLVRQLADELGLTSSGMLRNRWMVAEVEPAEAAEVPVGRSVRDRLMMVPGGVA